MNNHLRNYNLIRSSKGGIIKGIPTFMGKETNKELAESFTPVKALLLGLLNRPPSAQEEAIINATICLNIYPDIRIWTMRTGAFCAMNRAPFSASYGAALAACHSTIYGFQPLLKCSEMLRDGVKRQQNVKTIINEIKKGSPRIPGIGRPLISGPDERVAQLRNILAREHWQKGPHMELLESIEKDLRKEKQLYINFAGIVAALLLDPPFSLSVNQISLVSMELVHLPLMYSIHDVDENLEEYDPLLPLKISDVTYEGRMIRS